MCSLSSCRLRCRDPPNDLSHLKIRTPPPANVPAEKKSHKISEHISFVASVLLVVMPEIGVTFLRLKNEWQLLTNTSAKGDNFWNAPFQSQSIQNSSAIQIPNPCTQILKNETCAVYLSKQLNYKLIN